MSKDRLCESCNENKSIGVANALGPVSTAFCESCAKGGIFPWWNVVGYLGMAGPGLFHPEYEEILQANLKFHGKTREEFESEGEQLLDAYQKRCKEV